MTDVIGSLVFDSWFEPIPELRAPTLKDRHLIYEGGGVILDLLLTKSGDDTCIHIGGQVIPEDNQRLRRSGTDGTRQKALVHAHERVR